MPSLPSRVAALCAAALLCTPGHAQMAVFKHFQHYPSSGQWQQELVGYRDGKALGPPVTSTRCAGPLGAGFAADLSPAVKSAAPTCTTRILTDEERLAVSETACKTGAGVQVVHTEMRAIDDKTIANETRSAVNGQAETVLRSKVTYLGPCPAGAAAAQSQPSAADCADLAQARKDNEAAGGAGQCAQLPPQYRARCEAGVKMMAALEARCR